MSHDPKSKDFDPYSAWLEIASGTRPPTPEELVGVPPGETDSDRIINAGMARKKRLDGFALSEHRKLADAINKEVADAVSLLLKRAESAPKHVGPLQAELAVEVVPGAPVETPVKPTMGVPVEEAPQPTVRVPVQSTPQAVAPASPARGAASQAAQEERRLREAAEAAGLVVLSPSPAGVEPLKERAGDGSLDILRFWGWLMLSPFRLIDAVFRAIASEDNDVIHWFLRIMAVASLCVVCGVLLYHRSAEPPIVVVGGGEPSGSDEPAETDDDLLLEEALRELEMLDADQESRAAAPEPPSPPPRPLVLRPYANPGATAASVKEIAINLGGGVTMDLVLIPAGSFLMGSPDSDTEASGNEKPQHRVRIIRPFYLGKYEVTQEQWQAVMGANPRSIHGPKNPVERASWDDCQAFVKNLNDKHGGGGIVFGLPTEAQWEYACRAGSTTRWCFGDSDFNLAEYAWYDSNSNSMTHPVGQKKPNAWGLYDTHGNVWEWCVDWYGDESYAESQTEDPIGPNSGTSRVLRGGSCYLRARVTRSAFRFSFTPDRPFNVSGFRVARTP